MEKRVTQQAVQAEKTAPSVQKAEENQFKKEAKELKAPVVSLAFMLPLMYIAMGYMVGAPYPPGLRAQKITPTLLTQFCSIIPVLFINRGHFIRGFKSLYHRAPNMDTLIAVGSAAVLYGIYALYRITAMAAGDWETVHAMGMQLYFESPVMILTRSPWVSFWRHEPKAGQRIR